VAQCYNNAQTSHFLANFFACRTVAVTGAAGTIGKELIRQLIDFGVSEVRAFDNDENGLFELDCVYRLDARVRINHCDISAPNRTRRAFEGVDYLFHAAALKHVPICERTPSAAIDINVRGVTNIVEAALESGVRRVLFTSSDKAVHPTNVMGASKLLGERVALTANKRNGTTIISCTRFGNVAGSRGSVVPLFCSQILRGGSITLTSPLMTRFFMSKEAAVALVIESMVHAKGGELFVTKMPALRIVDLATVMIQMLAPAARRRPDDIRIDVIGPRPGEKCYEELVSEEELFRTVGIGDFLIVQPPSRVAELDLVVVYEHLGVAERLMKPYNSGTEVAMSRSDIAAFLRDNRLLSDLVEEPELRTVAAV